MKVSVTERAGEEGRNNECLMLRHCIKRTLRLHPSLSIGMLFTDDITEMNNGNFKDVL